MSGMILRPLNPRAFAMSCECQLCGMAIETVVTLKEIATGLVCLVPICWDCDGKGRERKLSTDLQVKYDHLVGG